MVAARSLALSTRICPSLAPADSSTMAAVRGERGVGGICTTADRSVVWSGDQLGDVVVVFVVGVVLVGLGKLALFEDDDLDSCSVGSGGGLRRGLADDHAVRVGGAGDGFDVFVAEELVGHCDVGLVEEVEEEVVGWFSVEGAEWGCHSPVLMLVLLSCLGFIMGCFF